MRCASGRLDGGSRSSSRRVAHQYWRTGASWAAPLVPLGARSYRIRRRQDLDCCPRWIIRACGVGHQKGGNSDGLAKMRRRTRTATGSPPGPRQPGHPRGMRRHAQAEPASPGTAGSSRSCRYGGFMSAKNQALEGSPAPPRAPTRSGHRPPSTDLPKLSRRDYQAGPVAPKPSEILFVSSANQDILRAPVRQSFNPVMTAAVTVASS